MTARDFQPQVPVDLRDADRLVEAYGQWAQDRYRKQRCASAEGGYTPPTHRDDEPPRGLMPGWQALQVQHALAVVPMQYRRVLQAFYIPQRLPHHAVRRRLGIRPDTWELSRVEGLRRFWAIYRFRYSKH